MLADIVTFIREAIVGTQGDSTGYEVEESGEDSRTSWEKESSNEKQGSRGSTGSPEGRDDE